MYNVVIRIWRGVKMKHRILRYILLYIVLFALILKPYTYKPSMLITVNSNNREELIADTGTLSPFTIIQKFKNSSDIKVTPKLLDKILAKQFILFNLLIWYCCYLHFFKIDLRQKIIRLIATYFHGSKYKDNPLFI